MDVPEHAPLHVQPGVAEQLCSAPYRAATWAGVACTIVDLMMRIILRVDQTNPETSCNSCAVARALHDTVRFMLPFVSLRASTCYVRELDITARCAIQPAPCSWHLSWYLLELEKVLPSLRI
jgi:hypothetical protein